MGRPVEDLVGRKFNSFEVIGRDYSKTDRPYWFCKCNCGNPEILSIRGSHLKGGTIKKCKRCSTLNDLTGKTFEHLTVLKRDFTRTDSSGNSYWICECDCVQKTQISVQASNLKTGNTTSCGCTTSKGENRICKLFEQYNIEYKKQYSFNDLKDNKVLRFDFAVFNKNKLSYLIEYQGIQHYEENTFFGGKEQFIKQQKHDEEKRKYCKENNIQLIEIPYWDFAKINLDYLKEKMGDLLWQG